ncbi:beta-lactamase-like protein [Paraphoma chrysanthemicola]|nr:beta-lactamase-like protein [Paraphoma chrysanthemicola]
MASTASCQSNATFELPECSSFCDLSVIDAHCDMASYPYTLVEPNIAGHQWLNLPTFCFYIKHRNTNAKLLFDLGCRKDWHNSVPSIVDLCKTKIPGLRVGSDVIDILEAGGVQRDALQAVILSHWHYDHCGDPARLDKKTDLVVGQGFKDKFYPGYPRKKDSTFWEAAFEGRNVVEVPFSANFEIGGLRAHDYFDDGSLYILDIPGHAIGHIGALVRTSSNSAVLLGGDACHFTGMLRPSERKQLPNTLPLQTVRLPHISSSCPCDLFTSSHPDSENSNKTPFYRPSSHKDSFYVEPAVAQQSLSALQVFDADPNVLILIAHDNAPRMVLPFYPSSTINDWKEQGYKDQMYWAFVNELPVDGRQRSEILADGLYDDQSNKLRDLLPAVDT